MASKKVELYAKKRYELDEIKNKIKEEFDKRKFSDVEFKDEIIRELGDTKTLLLIFENWFLRTGSYASLVIMLSEYQGILLPLVVKKLSFLLVQKVTLQSLEKML